MSYSTKSTINYDELEYLACVADASHVDRVIEQLSACGIPVRVQSVSTRSADEPPNCRYRLFVPQSNIDIARDVALVGTHNQ